MKTYRVVRFLSLLVIALVVGHAALLWGRAALLVAVAPSYGEFGIDAEGRVRRWVEEPLDFVRFLPSDEVAPGGTMQRDDWLYGGKHALLAQFQSSVPRPGARPEKLKLTKRVELVESPAGGWEAKGGSVPTALRVGGALVIIGDTEYDGLIHAPDRLLALSENGETLLTVDLSGNDVTAVRRTRLERPRVGVRTIYGYDGGDFWGGKKFSGVVGDEFWVVDRDGRFEQREPLGIRSKYILKSSVMKGTQAYLGLPGRPRPDRLPLLAVIAQPGKALMVRHIILEPETPFQIAMDAGIGVLASLRPLPFNIHSSTQLGASSIETMLVHFWEDPYFGQGANLGWLVMTLLVSLVCAFIAKRWARRRAPHAVWTWTVAVLLLGPMGLLWMRMTIPWVAMEDGRPVNLESPDWPEPARTGTEVFA